MIVSRNFLLEFFPNLKHYSIEDISDALFRSGVEVEKCEEIIVPTGLFYGIVKSCKKIKESDKLNLCQVEVPLKNQIFQIVCAASNVRKDLRVVVSLPGAVLQGGKMKIEKRKVFNVDSEGMLCSYFDLYKSDLLNKSFDNEGIIELSKDWDISKEFNPTDIGLDDVIFVLSIPSNRSDLNCVWGLAKELSKNLDVSNSVRDMGVLHYDDGNSWAFKRLLLTNNFVCGDYRENLNSYVYAAFNETIFEKKDFQVKAKSAYFSKLCEDYLRNVGFHDISSHYVSRKYLPFAQSVDLNWNETFSVLGLGEMSKRKIMERLNRFQFGFSPDSGILFPPAWRSDIQTNRDFLEEILRIIDMGSIHEESPCSRLISVDNSYVLAIEAIRELFRNRNFFECVTFNLHKQSEGELSVMNPISNKHVSMRRHALFELLDILDRNHKRKNSLKPIFEIVEIWNVGWTLNILVPGVDNSFPLNSTKINNDLYDLRALLRRVFFYLNQSISFRAGAESNLFSKKNLLDVYCEEGEKIGSMGFLERTKLGVSVWGAVVRLNWRSPKNYFVPDFSEFPASFKDISIEILDANRGIGEIISSLKGDYLKHVGLVEKYEDDKGMISYLLRCKFQSNEKTLSKSEIDEAIDSIYKCLEKMNIRIR